MEKSILTLKLIAKYLAYIGLIGIITIFGNDLFFEYKRNNLLFFINNHSWQTIIFLKCLLLFIRIYSQNIINIYHGRKRIAKWL